MDINVRGNNSAEYDQYFTLPAVAEQCIAALEAILNERGFGQFKMILEPAAGQGAFVKPLQTRGLKVQWIDKDAANEEDRADFLAMQVLPLGTALVIGNPPFGKNASTAVRFFNHAAQFAAVIAFIVPCSFQKGSVQNKLDPFFHLVREVPLDATSFTFNGVPTPIPCVFQIWGKTSRSDVFSMDVTMPHGRRPRHKAVTETADFTFVNNPATGPSGRGRVDIAMRRVGVNAGRLYTDHPSDKSKQSHLFIRVKDIGKVQEVYRRLLQLKLGERALQVPDGGEPLHQQDRAL